MYTISYDIAKILIPMYCNISYRALQLVYDVRLPLKY